MRTLILFSTFLALAATATAQCEDKKTTLDISQCLKAELKKADTELNRTYQQVLKKLKTPDAERLRLAQRAWIAYRDTECNAEFELWDGGTGGHVALPQCKLTLTKARTAEIEETYSRYEKE